MQICPFTKKKTSWFSTCSGTRPAGARTKTHMTLNHVTTRTIRGISEGHQNTSITRLKTVRLCLKESVGTSAKMEFCARNVTLQLKDCTTLTSISAFSVIKLAVITIQFVLSTINNLRSSKLAIKLETLRKRFIFQKQNLIRKSYTNNLKVSTTKL